MFKIRLAGVLIGIEHRYECVAIQCREYIEDTSEAPVFTAAVTEAECLTESRENPAYGESLCLYRKICLALLEKDAYLIHAAAIAMDGQAYLFAAPSGTGKTTHIRLWRKVYGDRVMSINGDKPILRFTEDGLQAFGTPWCGKEHIGGNRHAPVKALCFLEQSPANSLIPMDATDALERMMHQVLLPKDEAGMARMLTLLERTLSTIPCYLLRCNMEDAAARIACEGMKGACKC